MPQVAMPLGATMPGVPVVEAIRNLEPVSRTDQQAVRRVEGP